MDTDNYGKLFQAFQKKYQSAGYVINPYSDEWIKAVQERVEQGEINYDSDTETYESFDEDHGTDYRNHLLIIYADPYNKELIQDLRAVHTSLDVIYGSGDGTPGTHKPDFVFVNFKANKMLCVGLGRKNRLFQYDADRYVAGDRSSTVDVLRDSVMDEECTEYVDNFRAYDHDQIISRTVYYLKTLGEYLVEDYHLNFNPEMIVSGPNEDGLYEFDDDREPIDQDEYDNLCGQYENINTYISECIEGINVFFPMADVAALNTEDF